MNKLGSGLLMSLAVGFSSTVAAQDELIPIETRLPVPRVSAIHLDRDCHVLQLDFVDGSSLRDVEVGPVELRGITIREFYHIPLDCWTLGEGQSTDVVLRCRNHSGPTYCPKLEEDVERYQVNFAENWVVESIQEPGKEPVYDRVDLAKEDLVNVDVLGHRALRLIRYQEAGSEEEKMGILTVPAPW